MARPISWLPRVHEIRRSVAESVRSHYTRAELQLLFEVQSSEASKLLEILRTVKVGSAHLVAREDLLRFVDRAKASDDVAALKKQMRAEKAGVSRRKIRSLVQRDIEAASLTGLPETLKLEVGRVEITFHTGEQLVRNLWTLAFILEDQEECDEFMRRYVPVVPNEEEQSGAEEMRTMFADLEKREAAYLITGPKTDQPSIPTSSQRTR